MGLFSLKDLCCFRLPDPYESGRDLYIDGVFFVRFSMGPKHLASDLLTMASIRFVSLLSLSISLRCCICRYEGESTFQHRSSEIIDRRRRVLYSYSGDGESDSIEVSLWVERSGAANVEDAFWVLFGFEEVKCGSGFFFALRNEGLMSLERGLWNSIDCGKPGEDERTSTWLKL